MNQLELAHKVAEKLSLSASKAEDIVSCIFESMRDAMVREERIELRGFGSFQMRHYGAYSGRNPRTGETIDVSPKRLPHFKVGKDLNEMLNREGSHAAEQAAPTVSSQAKARRAHERTAISLAVEYEKLSTFLVDYTLNISKGGMFLKTDTPLPVGTQLRFAVQVPHLDDPLQLRGRVTWIRNSAEPEADAARPPGMGIELLFATADERARVEQQVVSLIEERMGADTRARLLGDDA